MVVDKRNFWQKRSNWQRGLIIGLAFLVIGAMYYAVDAFKYTGNCGEGLLPFLGSNKHSCSWFEYLRTDYYSDYVFLIHVLFEDFWWVIILLILVPTLTGFGMDIARWGQNKNENI